MTDEVGTFLLLGASGDLAGRLLLPALGNGLVAVGESHGAPSGIAALLVAAVPLWVVVYRTIAGDRPRTQTLVGVLLGFGEGDIADQTVLALALFRRGHAVDADIDDGGA